MGINLPERSKAGHPILAQMHNADWSELASSLPVKSPA
ncbi:hypothetical protein HY17_00445 [Hyphomonas sp. CY54-11-8]|jgi:hypothetical protein|nr:hypothetical protein HY17_00445 [Hyphomonas sp. CY54-11-8]